ncbi:MAG: heme o synthase [Candidatus Bipolaricaulia bacterium]
MRHTSAARPRIADYIALTKPRIVGLVLVTTLSGMWLAAHGWPSASVVLWTLLGTGLAAGSAQALNAYLDRDFDARMHRTQNRPLPAGRLVPSRALSFGIALGITAFALLAVAVNLLSAGLALATILFYVFVYTLWLKRTTSWCTVIGGVSGAMPPLIGWAAVTGGLGPPAWVLFAILFLWQPPHFWSLALVYLDDYRRAEFPMLPVVQGGRATRRQMLLYIAALVPVSILLYPMGVAGPLYLAIAVGLGLGYIVQSVRFALQDRLGPDTLFFYSIIYLTLLFVTVVINCRC